MKNRSPHLKSLVAASFRLSAIGLSILALSATARAATYTWDGDSGSNIFWSTPNNWTANSGTPSTGDIVSFTTAGAATSGDTSEVTTNTTIATMSFTGQSTTLQQTVKIDSGITLTLSAPTGSGTILGVGLNTVSTSTPTKAYFTGTGGSLTLAGGTAKNIVIGNAGTDAILDMSGLSTFTATVANVYMSHVTGLSADAARSRFTLAQNSTITASGTIGMASGSSGLGNGVAFLDLGQTTVLNTPTLVVGNSKGSAFMSFQNSVTSAATLKLRGTNGSAAMTNFNIGGNGVNGTVAALADVDLRRGDVDASVTNLNVGVNTGTVSLAVTAALKISSTGVTPFAVTTANIATNSAGTTGTGVNGLTGTVAVGGDAEMTIGTLNLGVSSNAASTKSINGLLLVNGGSVTINTAANLGADASAALVSAEIRVTLGGLVTINAGSGIQAELTSNAASNSIVTVDGGTLNMTGKNLGTATNSIKTLNFLSGELVDLGTINGTGGVTKTGTGVLKISTTGANVSGYTGGTTINGGLLSFESANAVPASGTITVNSGGVAFGYSGNVQTILNSGIINSASTGSIALTSSQGSQNIDLSAFTGMYLGAYGNVTYTGAYTPASAGVYRLGGGTGNLNYASNLSGSDSVVIGGGTGTVILSGTNSYTGSTTLNAGTLQLSNIDDIGSSTALNFDGGTLKFGTGVTNDLSSGRTLTFNSGGATFDTNGNNVTFASAVGNSGTGGLTKTGLGTLTLSGANTYTGATSVTRGTLNVNLAGGNNRINSASTLTLGGGTLNITGAGTGTSSQTLGNVTLAANSASKVVINPSTGSGTTLTLGNTWTRGTGSTVNFNTSLGSGTVTSNPSAQVVNSIIKYATVTDSTSTGFATVTGGNIVRYTGGSTFTASSNASGTNFTYTAAASPLTMLNSGSYNSLAINAGTSGGGIDLGGFTGTTGALLMTGSQNFTISNGHIGIRTNYDAAAGEFIIHQYGAGVLDISASVNTNGTLRASNNYNLSNASLVKAGTGTLKLSGSSLYTGNTLVSEGTLILDGTLASSNVIVNDGATFGGAGTMTESITVNAGASVAPGTIGTLGTLSADNLTWNGDSTMKFQLSGMSSSDKISLTGVFAMGLDGAYTFDFQGTGVDGGVYTLLTFNNTTFADASAFTYTNIAANTAGSFSFVGNSLVFTAVPEPGTWALLATGLGMIFFFHRRRRTV